MSTYDHEKATDHAADEADGQDRGCPQDRGQYIGRDCDPFLGCPFAGHESDGCGCCFIHCCCDEGDYAP